MVFIDIRHYTVNVGLRGISIVGTLISLPFNNAPHIIGKGIKVWRVKWPDFGRDEVVKINHHLILGRHSFVSRCRVLMK